MSNFSSGDEFWDVVDDLGGEFAVSEAVEYMSPWVAGVQGIPLAIAGFEAVLGALTGRVSKGELLVLEAEAIARSLPAAYAESSEQGTSTHLSVGHRTTDSDIGPLIESWVRRLAERCRDDDRIERVSGICIALLDDLYVRVVDDLSPFRRDVVAIQEGLWCCS